MFKNTELDSGFNYTIFHNKIFSCFLGIILKDKIVLLEPSYKVILKNEINSIEIEKKRDMLANFVISVAGVTIVFLDFIKFSQYFFVVGFFMILIAIKYRRSKLFIKIRLNNYNSVYIPLKSDKEKKGQIFVKKIKEQLIKKV